MIFSENVSKWGRVEIIDRNEFKEEWEKGLKEWYSADNNLEESFGECREMDNHELEEEGGIK